jgi:hypothetical protein
VSNAVLEKISIERHANKFKFHPSPMIKKTGEVAATRFVEK